MRAVLDDLEVIDGGDDERNDGDEGGKGLGRWVSAGVLKG